MAGTCRKFGISGNKSIKQNLAMGRYYCGLRAEVSGKGMGITTYQSSQIELSG
jgi:hypothetical protein